MSNPLALLPLVIAAGGGRISAAGESAPAYEAQQLIAAGLTLLQRSAPLVRALSGRRSAILLPTSPAFLTALAASDGRGAVLVNPLAAPAEIAYQCDDAKVGAIFTITAFASRLPPGLPAVYLDAAPNRATVTADGRTTDVDLGSHHGLTLEGERDVEGRDEELAVVYTSAMRGRALGAILTHRNLLANARSTIEAMAITRDDHVLAVLPYAHLFGLTVTATAPLLVGGRVTTVDRFNPLKAADLLLSGVTMLTGVPAVYHALLTVIARKGLDLRHSAIRLCICGGAALPVELQDRWADVTGHELRQGYGLTEAGPVCLVNRADRPNVRGTMGIALPRVEVGIFPPARYNNGVTAEPEVESLADGVAGEICIRGDNVFSGYVGAEAGLPRRGAWLCTGDDGLREPDGSVRFLGLLKPMFTRNGFNVYPREVERVVSAMPGVVRADVTSRPDPVKENEVVLHVVGSVGEDDVKRWCEEHLSAYKQPSVIEIVPVNA
ncbi:MAG: AMP-binding protein [Gemmatimonadota bacterium]|nr:AMP-binding protein [Gemmatimonadota bacterium]